MFLNYFGATVCKWKVQRRPFKEDIKKKENLPTILTFLCLKQKYSLPLVQTGEFLFFFSQREFFPFAFTVDQMFRLFHGQKVNYKFRNALKNLNGTGTWSGWFGWYLWSTRMVGIPSGALSDGADLITPFTRLSYAARDVYD